MSRIRSSDLGILNQFWIFAIQELIKPVHLVFEFWIMYFCVEISNFFIKKVFLNSSCYNNQNLYKLNLFMEQTHFELKKSSREKLFNPIFDRIFDARFKQIATWTWLSIHTTKQAKSSIDLNSFRFVKRRCSVAYNGHL